ncbi:MAG: hypothetical protein ACREET_09805 [Stellaceae bacterium]
MSIRLTKAVPGAGAGGAGAPIERAERPLERRGEGKELVASM